MASISQTPPRPGAARGGRFNPTPGRVRYSMRWLGVGAGLGALSALALSRGGWPAALGLGAAGLAGAVYAMAIEPQLPELSAFDLRLPNLPQGLDGLRIGHLSDLHLGHPFADRNSRWAVEQVMGASPDLIVFTGDFVSYPEPIADLAAIAAPLRAPLGIYAVPGNHDYWEGLPEIQAHLEPLGVEFLINRGRLLSRGGEQLYIAGVDDAWDGRPDLGAALAGAPDGVTTLLLSHVPDTADEAAASGVHLQLSGHTHGGHMRLPGLGSFCLPRYGWRYPVGHEQVGDMQLYVSRGLGGIPLRLGCRPEAGVITLRRG